MICEQGLGAPTAGIAKEAGVANGSLFTYFATKQELLNQLYLALKLEMVTASMDGVLGTKGLREQCYRAWKNWTNWPVNYPAKRRVLTQLAASGELTAETRAAGDKLMTGLAMLVERGREGGAMRQVPLRFVVAIMNAVSEATQDYMTQDPANAEKHCKQGFEAFWRMVK